MGNLELGDVRVVFLGLPVGALINCCDNSGAKNLYIIAVKVGAAQLRVFLSSSRNDQLGTRLLESCTVAV